MRRSPRPASSDPDRFPLSVAQARLWQLGALAPGTAWGNLPLCFEVRGPLRPQALGVALRDVVERQPILRTRYEETETGVWGRVEPTPDEVLEIDPVTDDPASAMRRSQEEARRALDPTRGGLFRARWSPTGPQEGVLFFLTHHLVTDGWSIALLLRELSACYAARVSGQAPNLPRIEGSFAAEATAEAGRGVEPGDLAYWRERLDGAPREVSLPVADASAGDEAYRSEKTLGHIDPTTAAALRDLAVSEGVTPFAALLAALQIVLARYAGQDDLVVGTTVSVRDGAVRERLVGNFGNNLLLRTWLGGDPSPRDVLRRIRDTLPRDLAHQRLPLEHLLSDGAQRLPRLNVLFMLRDGSPEDHLTLRDCETTYRPIDVGASTLDLSLDVFDQGELGFALAFECRSVRIDAAEAKALNRDFEHVVAATVADPDRSCSRVEIRHGCWSKTQASTPVVGAGGSEWSAEASEPMTDSEAYLAAIWREALGIESVDAHDNFFELGGYSLLAISLLEQVEETTGVRLTPVDLVSQTLAQLATSLDAGAAGSSASGSRGSIERDAQRGRGRSGGVRGGFLGKLRRRRGHDG